MAKEHSTDDNALRADDVLAEIARHVNASLGFERESVHGKLLVNGAALIGIAIVKMLIDKLNKN